MLGEGLLITILLFIVRLALPLGVLLGLGYLYEHFVAKRSVGADRERQPATRVISTVISPQVGYSAQSPPCWEVNRCTPEMMQHCPVPQRPGVPCWLTKQLLQGQLPDKCLGCEVFKGSSTAQYPA
jgi:hypothetical protein